MVRNMVVKDNTLINASYTIGLVEQRLLLLAIAKSRKEGLEINHIDYFPIRAEEYAKSFNANEKNIYRDLKKACDTLFGREFSYKTGSAVVISRWIQGYKYEDNTGEIHLLFTRELVPFISQLEKRFTSYFLEDVSKMTSVYAIRLYELIISWRYTHKTPIFKLEELREKLGVEPEEYPRMNNFKSRVLNVAVDQINEFSNIHIEIEQHKKGRAIYGFSFDFVEIQDQRDPNTVDWVNGQPDKKIKKILPEYVFNDDAIQGIFKGISRTLKSDGHNTEEAKKLFAKVEIDEVYNAISNKYRVVDDRGNPINEVTFREKLSELFGIKSN